MLYHCLKYLLLKKQTWRLCLLLTIYQQENWGPDVLNDFIMAAQ